MADPITIPLIKSRIVAQAALFLTTTYGANVGKAFPTIPLNILDTQLPACIVIVPAADYDVTTYGTQSFQETRDFLLQFVVANLAKGSEGQAEDAALALIDPAIAFWRVRHRLELVGKDPLTDILSSTLIGDAGLRSTRYPQNSESAPYYAQIEFRLRVVRKRRIQYI